MRPVSARPDQAHASAAQRCLLGPPGQRLGSWAHAGATEASGAARESYSAVRLPHAGVTEAWGAAHGKCFLSKEDRQSAGARVIAAKTIRTIDRHA